MNYKSIIPYIKLIRLDKPVGILLLLFPALWAIWLSGENNNFLISIFFIIGAITMRGAGCAINDIIDRDFDKQVERTKTRPIASGEITIFQAILFIIALIFISLIIALQMNNLVLILAASSLIFVVAYPFMKRITWFPQAFLGLTFNFGVLMGWAAVTGSITIATATLYIGSIFWTLGYDTIYAHQDKKDDIKIGVKSTALRFAENSKIWLFGFYTLAIIFWGITGIIQNCGYVYFIALLLCAIHSVWQIIDVNLDNPDDCAQKFRSNITLALILLVGILL